MPDVFVQFCQWFHQDVFILYPSCDQAISAFVAQLDDTNKMTLNFYLEGLIESDATDAELEKLWREQEAHFLLAGSWAIRRLFAETMRCLPPTPGVRESRNASECATPRAEVRDDSASEQANRSADQRIEFIAAQMSRAATPGS